jgi:hypothetical protein
MTPSTENLDPIFITERPDWGQSVLIDRMAATQVFVSHDGTEQRQRRLTTSKLDTTYTVDALQPADAFARELSILDELQAPVVMPVWPYSIPVTAQAGNVLTVGDQVAFYPFRLGGWVFVEDDNGEAFYPLASVDGDANQLTLGGGVPQFSNATAYPCVFGIRKDGSATIKTIHTDTSETVAVEETNGAGLKVLNVPLLGGLPVFAMPPNFDQGISFKYGTRQNTVKSVGSSSTQFPQLRPQATMSRTYTCRTKQEAVALAGFWEAMAGQFGAFWTPSWRNQLAVEGSPRAGAMTLKLSRTVNYQARFMSGPNPDYATGAYLYLHDFINPPQFIKVAGSVLNDDGTETLQLVTGVPLNYTHRRFVCGLVVLARFAADTMEETWSDENTMEVPLALLEVTNFRPDAEPTYYIPGWPEPPPPVPRTITFHAMTFIPGDGSGLQNLNATFPWSCSLDGGAAFTPEPEQPYVFNNKLDISINGNAVGIGPNDASLGAGFTIAAGSVADLTFNSGNLTGHSDMQSTSGDQACSFNTSTNYTYYLGRPFQAGTLGGNFPGPFNLGADYNVNQNLAAPITIPRNTSVGGNVNAGMGRTGYPVEGFFPINANVAYHLTLNP